MWDTRYNTKFNVFLLYPNKCIRVQAFFSRQSRCTWTCWKDFSCRFWKKRVLIIRNVSKTKRLRIFHVTTWAVLLWSKVSTEMVWQRRSCTWSPFNPVRTPLDFFFWGIKGGEWDVRSFHTEPPPSYKQYTV